MFATDITLFNYIEQEDEYIPTLIKGVEFQPKYKTEPNNYDTSDKTSSLIIIPYYKDNNGVYANKNEYKKYYLTPKRWINSNHTEYFTIQNDIDFVMIGNYLYLTEINLNELKNSYDDLFMINQYKDFRDELSHFELIVN